VNAADLLRLVESEPRVTYEPGEQLIKVGDLHPRVFVLASGVLQVERDGRVLARFDEGGSITGEISLLLGSPATADVVAVESSVVHVVDDAERYLDQQPEFARHLAEVLARRLSKVTSYIDDVYRQFEQHGGTLGLVPQVLDDLLGSQRQAVDSGSDREPDSPY
jgi:CRP/FNR family transcriptional regulator, cyclic AMP receptor protein